MIKPLAPAARSAAFKAKGRQVAVVLTDKAASDALDALSGKYGSQRAAIEHCLLFKRQREG